MTMTMMITGITPFWWWSVTHLPFVLQAEFRRIQREFKLSTYFWLCSAKFVVHECGGWSENDCFGLADWKHVLRSLSADEAPQGRDLVLFRFHDVWCQLPGRWRFFYTHWFQKCNRFRKQKPTKSLIWKNLTLFEENYVHEIIRQILSCFRHFLQFWRHRFFWWIRKPLMVDLTTAR